MPMTPEGCAMGIAGRKALADARARQFMPIISEIRKSGVTRFTEIAREMNARGCLTLRGETWCGWQVRSVMQRLGMIL